MTSLDGYTLNEKIDKEFERINEQIAILKFRIETEMQDIEKRFAKLTEVASKKPVAKQPKAKA